MILIESENNRPESNDSQSQGSTTTKRNRTIRLTGKTDGNGFRRRKDGRYEASKQTLKAETNQTHDDIMYSKKTTLAFMPERMSEKASSLWYIDISNDTDEFFTKSVKSLHNFLTFICSGSTMSTHIMSQLFRIYTRCTT